VSISTELVELVDHLRDRLVAKAPLAAELDGRDQPRRERSG
jgi:hypothetical protein